MSSEIGRILEGVKDTSQIGRLQSLANRFGDFQVYVHVGDFVSKRRSVFQCWEDSTEEKWLTRANYRTRFKHEIILDIDSPIVDGKVPEDVVHEVIDRLVQQGLRFSAWETGGKGYHIHIYEPDLPHLCPDIFSRNRIRKHLMRQAGADFMMLSEKGSIQIEGRPHRKTMKKKKLIFCNGYIKDLEDYEDD